MYRPTIDEVKRLGKEYNVIPICRELHSDMLTPIGVLKTLQTVSPKCFLFESAEDSKKWGRYTYLGYDPRRELSFRDKSADSYIEQILNTCKSPSFDYMPPFTGGLVGYFSYDYAKYSEPTLQIYQEDSEKLNDVELILFDKIIAFDNLKQKVFLIVNMKMDDLETEYKKALAEIDEMERLIKSGNYAQGGKTELKSELRPLFSKEEYCGMVEKAKDYIREGDIFQVVLSNCFEAELEGSLLDTYRVLRTTNPSPYMFYFCSEDTEIVGASPETLVKLENGILHTFPLAGTRARGETDDEDIRLEKELLSDEKELAEHNMLVDLGRNDLGRISKFGTVEVEKYLSVLRFSHVMHLGSTIRSEIRDDKTALDAIRAVLPAGTLSGAPKIRACQIIEELENNKRGVYGGAIGYLDFKGNMDTCIAIRLAFKKNGKVFIRSGAGIVADSVPENEYQECINKAKSVMQALKLAEGGIS